MSGVVLAAIYMLWAYQRAFQGPGAERHRGLVDLLPRENAAVVPVVAVMLLLGVVVAAALRLDAHLRTQRERVHHLAGRLLDPQPRQQVRGCRVGLRGDVEDGEGELRHQPTTRPRAASSAKNASSSARAS